MITKGEWKAGYNPGVTGPTTPSFQPFCGKDWPYKTINVGEETIAIIPSPDTDKMHQPNLLELEANANLIAASPNLYEACRETMFVIRQFNELLARHAKDDEIVGVMDALLDNPIWEQALAKAEGKKE